MSDYIHPLDRRRDWMPSAADEARQELNEHLERASSKPTSTIGDVPVDDIDAALAWRAQESATKRER